MKQIGLSGKNDLMAISESTGIFAVIQKGENQEARLLKAIEEEFSEVVEDIITSDVYFETPYNIDIEFEAVMGEDKQLIKLELAFIY